MRPVAITASDVIVYVTALTTGTMTAPTMATMSSVALLVDTEVPVTQGALPLLWLDMCSSSAAGATTHVGTRWLGCSPTMQLFRFLAPHVTPGDVVVGATPASDQGGDSVPISRR